MTLVKTGLVIYHAALVHLFLFIVISSGSSVYGQQLDDRAHTTTLSASTQPIPILTPTPTPTSTSYIAQQQREQFSASDLLTKSPSLPLEEELRDTVQSQQQEQQKLPEPQLSKNPVDKEQQRQTVNDILKGPTSQNKILEEEKEEEIEQEAEQKLDDKESVEDNGGRDRSNGGAEEGEEEQKDRDDDTNSNINDDGVPLDLQLPIPFP